MQPVIIVYALGAAFPGDIAAAVAGRIPCVLAAERNPHTLAAAPLLEQCGPLVWVDSMAEAVLELARYSPGGIVTFSEQAVRLTSELACELGLSYHSDRTAGMLTDKSRQRAALREAGVDSVRHARLHDGAQWPDALTRVGLPAVLKPAYGGGSRNTFLVEDADEGRCLVERLLTEGRPGFGSDNVLVLEEYLRGCDNLPFGDYVSVEQVTQRGTTTDIAVTGKFPLAPPFRETGRFWPSALSREDEQSVLRLARRAISALGIVSGLTHTEFKLTADGPRLIEVNGRLGGGIDELSRQKWGISLIESGCRVALGQLVGIPEMTWDKVIFHRFHPAPQRPCDVVALSGGAEVRRLSGVSMYRPCTKPGARLEGGVQTEWLDIVMGEAGSHQELRVITSHIDTLLSYTFAFDDPPRHHVVRADELATL